MDTSQKYFESLMSDFKSYGRGRSLEQFCRDEAVDFKRLVNWLMVRAVTGNSGGLRHRSLGPGQQMIRGQRTTAQCDLFDKIMAAAIRRDCSRHWYCAASRYLIAAGRPYLSFSRG